MEVTREVALQATQAAEERKASNVVLLDLRGLTLVTDYFLIASGDSGRQVRAIAEHVEEVLENSGVRVLHREGLESAKWVLLDCGGLVCHVFNHAERDFYSLERFWGDARRLWPQEAQATREAAAAAPAPPRGRRPATRRRRPPS